MTSEKLTALIEKERATLEKLKNRRAELDEKIKKSEAKLTEYEMMDNNKKFGAMASIVTQSGLSMDDVLAALQSGDLLSLQEQMEAQKQENHTEPEAETQNDANNEAVTDA